MDLRTLDTLVPAITARGAIVEKGRERRKVIGDYLNNHRHRKPVGAAEGCDLLILKKTKSKDRSLRQLLQEACVDQDFLAAALALTLRWRCASNRQTPVATETLRLLTLPAIGRFTR